MSPVPEITNSHDQVKIPAFGRAAVCKNRGPNYTLECVYDYPVPKPGYGQLLIKVVATGLCQSDHHYMKEDLGVSMDAHVDCPGHEGSGYVVQVGEGVDSAHWKVGDRAGIKPTFDVCGQCDLCRTENENLCDGVRWTGSNSNGSYCQYVLSPAHYTVHIPEGIPHELAGPILCSGGTVVSALKSSGVRPGQWVVVPGAGGGVGGMAVQYARAMGLRVVAIDGGDEKRKVCADLGAEGYIDFRTSNDVFADSRKITGSGAHAVLVTGGTASAYKDAHRHLRKLGTMVCIGIPDIYSGAIAGGMPVEICVNKISIKGSIVSNLADIGEALDFAARGVIKPHITTYSFDKFPEMNRLQAESKVVGRAVVFFEDDK
ncbi:GroES-like protein [Meredithblackwellia eburnea MCA 4105]